MKKEDLIKIGEYILDGLSEKDACTLVGIKYKDYLVFKEENEDVQFFIEKKKVTFKHNHLKEIQSRKSEKNSFWILEKLIPDEFGQKQKNQAPTINIINQILKDIQDDNTSIVVSRESIEGPEPTTEIEERSLSVQNSLR